MRVPFNWIATDFERIMASNFASEGQYSGPMWRPLTFKWQMHKIDVGKDHGILQYNRDLVRSLTVRHAKGSVRTIRRDEMILGTRIPYARFHTTGTEHMPRRNFMRIPVWDRRRWVKAIEHYIMTGSMT
jgi:phage gpG-like protein